MNQEIKLIRSTDIPTMRVSLRSDGIMQVEVEPGAYSTVENIKLATQAIGKVGEGKRYPLLIVAGRDSTMDTEAMAFLAKEESTPYTIAVAGLIVSVSQKLLGNFYLRFNKPKKPTKIFTQLDEAVHWLEQYRQS
jgi:hypothetical protein